MKLHMHINLYMYLECQLIVKVQINYTCPGHDIKK